jgi:hypothetical protein
MHGASGQRKSATNRRGRTVVSREADVAQSANGPTSRLIVGGVSVLVTWCVFDPKGARIS